MVKFYMSNRTDMDDVLSEKDIICSEQERLSDNQYRNYGRGRGLRDKRERSYNNGERGYNKGKQEGIRIRSVTPRENDIWSIPNFLLPSLQQHPWVRYILVRDGSWVFPVAYSSNPERFDFRKISWDKLLTALLLNPPFSIWEECALYFLDIAMKTGKFFLVIAPDQAKYEWHRRWFENEHKLKYTRIDLETPLAFQQGVEGIPRSTAPHQTSIFILGLEGEPVRMRNNASGYVYPNEQWLRNLCFRNNLKIRTSDFPFDFPARLQALKLAQDFRETEGLPEALKNFVPPELPSIQVSTSDEIDSVWSRDRDYNLPLHFKMGSTPVSREQRKERRVIRSLGQQLMLTPELKKHQKYWKEPIPQMCRICRKRGHPPNKCPKRVLREDECIFSHAYEQWLFRYITYKHKPYTPLRRPANMGLVTWFQREMARIQRDARHFQESFVHWVQSETGNYQFEWTEHPTFSFSELANAVHFWAAIGTPKYVLQRYVNGFRMEMTDEDISFEISNPLPPEKEKELFELHTKPYIESRKACIVPDWYPQVILSRFLVEEPDKKRPILDASPLTSLTVSTPFALPPPRSHESVMPQGFIFSIDGKSCFCNIPIRVQDRRFLCWRDRHINRMVAANHACFGVANGPEYADTFMGCIRNWLVLAIMAALWIDDMMFIFDKLDMTSDQCYYMLKMVLTVFKWLRVRLNKKCIIMPLREITFTGLRINTWHTRVLVGVEKLAVIGALVHQLGSQRMTTVKTLDTLYGKILWVVGKEGLTSKAHTLHYDLVEHKRRVKREYPDLSEKRIDKLLKKLEVPVPTYLDLMFSQVLARVEKDNYTLHNLDPTKWFIVCDVGDDAAGGFAYTATKTTQRRMYELPEKLKPKYDDNDSKETSSGTRELWGLMKLFQEQLRHLIDVKIYIRVDNMSVVKWVREKNPEYHMKKCPLRKMLIAAYDDFIFQRNLTVLIDHHPREQPAAQFADFLSKFKSHYEDWASNRLPLLKRRGASIMTHLGPKSFTLNSKRFGQGNWAVFNQNLQIPWEIIQEAIPRMKPIEDLLMKTPIITIPYGLRRQQPYREILRNLIRYKYTGWIVLPGFPRALNQALKLFTTYKIMKPRVHFNPPALGPQTTKYYAFFMRKGLCW